MVMSNLLKKHNHVGFLLACFLLGSDLYLKMISSTEFVKHQEASAPDLYIGRREEILSIGSLSISFNHVRNFGALWNIAAKFDPSIRIALFSTLSLVAIALLWFIYKAKWINVWIFVLLMAGAASNFFDRIRLGYVVDYLDFRFIFNGQLFRFPNFNLADVYLVIGIIATLYSMFFLSKAEGKT